MRRRLAGKRDSLQVEVWNLRSEVVAKSAELEKVKAAIEELAYNEGFHNEVQQTYDERRSEKTELIVKIAELRAKLEGARRS